MAVGAFLRNTRLKYVTKNLIYNNIVATNKVHETYLLSTYLCLTIIFSSITKKEYFCEVSYMLYAV